MQPVDNGQELGAHRFTYVVMADTHVNQGEHASSSPYLSTQLTNARARYAIHAINQIAPEFAIHLGDLTDPVPSLPAYPQAVEQFRALVRLLNCPVYFAPGNHDIGDKPVAWMPAKTVSDEYIAQFMEHFGQHYYAFDAHGCHFVVVNSPLINSGLEQEAAQRTWLEEDLATHAGQRTFFCTHYPLFLAQPDERSHYDNIDEPGRDWLLGLVKRYKPEALFTSHVHNFFFNRYADTDCYVLPAISFVRHDYSEFFRVGPADEYGRNDAAKLGFFVVKVYEQGHVVHVVRTGGATLPPDQPPAPIAHRLLARRTREQNAAPFGVHLRHPWAEITAIPATGAADEFERKKARNDYSLLALWEMGVRKLRVPLQDLADPATRARMQILQGMGHQFTVYSYGVPKGTVRDALMAYTGLVTYWEVVFSWQNLDAILDGVRRVRDEAPLHILLSKLRSKEEDEPAQGGSLYFHNIRHGFRPEEEELFDVLLARKDGMHTFDGLAFQLPRDMSPWPDLQAIARVTGARGLKASVELRMVTDNPAQAFVDDLANANRVAEAMAATLALREVDVFVDTLVDIDRGYFVRNGLVDRRYTPRLAGQVVRNLYAELGGTDGAELSLGDALLMDGGRIPLLQHDATTLALVLPQPAVTVSMLPSSVKMVGKSGPARWIELSSGVATALGWKQDAAAGEIRLTKPLRATVPALLVLENAT